MITGAENFNYSYWETKQYFHSFDLIVIGSGLIGLSTALAFKQKNKSARVLVLERGLLPNGASTKNAGFACFGSAGELLDDLARMPEELVWETVNMRWQGLQLLRKRLGDRNLAYKRWGGFELFDSQSDYERVLEQLPRLNRHIQQELGPGDCFAPDRSKVKRFNTIKGVLKNKFEGQLDTAQMMQGLLQLAQQSGILILNNISVTAIHETGQGVELQSNAGTFKAGATVVATNGFATQLLKLNDLKPARAQVLVTKPIEGLKLKGAYHYQQGYYYFRNIDNRVLFGGGRNLDFEGETTTDMQLSPRIQQELDLLLKEVILPGTSFEVEQRWTGIMGVGSEKKPIIAPVSKHAVAAVRMGGMGIAIGSLVGELAAKEVMS